MVFVLEIIEVAGRCFIMVCVFLVKVERNVNKKINSSFNDSRQKNCSADILKGCKLEKQL